MYFSGGIFGEGYPMRSMGLFAALAAVSISASPLAAQQLTVESGLMPVTIHGSAAQLDTIVVKRADATGKLPIAILTHGVARSAPERLEVRATSMLGQATDMALRGYLAVALVRRGFGLSSATNPPGGCGTGSFLPALRAGADEVEAVRKVVAARPDADPTRVVGLGVSVGGVTMLAWAAQKPEGLVGIVNVSGGTGSTGPNINCDAPALVAAATSFGVATAPTVWFYAANDTFFGPDLAKRMHDGFTGRGGKAVLHQFEAIGNDGHLIWSLAAGRQRWLPEMDKFLAANDLPALKTDGLDAVAAAWSEEGKAAFQRYLNAGASKVLMVSATKGMVRSWSGAADLDAARKSGLEFCERAAGEPCRVVMENFRPVAQ